MRDLLERFFWQIEANPFKAESYDWEEWASEAWLQTHWAPKVVQAVTDGR